MRRLRARVRGGSRVTSSAPIISAFALHYAEANIISNRPETLPKAHVLARTDIRRVEHNLDVRTNFISRPAEAPDAMEGQLHSRIASTPLSQHRQLTHCLGIDSLSLSAPLLRRQRASWIRDDLVRLRLRSARHPAPMH